VLLIPDQNGFFSDAASAQVTASQLAPALRHFLETGGVVAVLDGMWLDGGVSVPSDTHRVLDPSLLAIDGATQPLQGCASAPCNEADPLLADVPPEICEADHSVMFSTDEPWVALARPDPANVLQPFVLHRWFGTTDQGPIAFDVDTAQPGTDLSGYPAFFQDATGQQQAQCLTIGNGSAVHQMGPDSFVSLGVNSGSRQLVTVIGAQPLDRLEQRAQAAPSYGGPFQATASLPGAIQDVSAYRVMLGCGGTLSGDLTIVVDTAAGCANPDGSYSLVAEALDANGEILAYTIQNGVTDSDPEPIQLPAWRNPDFLPFTTGVTPAELQSIELGVRTAVPGGPDYVEGGATVLRDENGGQFSFYADPGAGQPAFALLTVRTRLRFFPSGQPYEVISERSQRGPLLDTLAIDRGAGFLPRVTASSIAFDAGQRLKIDWSLAGPAPSVDGGFALAFWNRTSCPTSG
jgi:hypothetical protein